MYLSHLALHEFRNYKQLDLALNSGLSLFYGKNAQGKTNMLEAVVMLATGSSFHAAADREVVNWHAPEHVARIEGVIKRIEDAVQIEIAIFDPTPPLIDEGSQTTVPGTIELPAGTPRKRIKLNDIPRRPLDLIGQIKVVLFAPTDLHLVDGSPDERRRFLDRALCQLQPRYCQTLMQYRKIVTQRAALLKRIRENAEDPHMLDYLDDQLTARANLLIFERQRMVVALNEQAEHFQHVLSSGQEHLDIVYRPSFKIDPAWDLPTAEGHYRTQLHEAQRKEILQGVCLLGPHRDDLEFRVNGVNLSTYGSRGQQRTAALSTKLAELAYMRVCTGEEPILLLDDVFSELDHRRREHLLHQIRQHEQVLLTTTDLHGFPAEILDRAHIYEVNDGALKRQ